MSEKPKVRLYDRSRVTTDWRCRRRRYYNYEHNGIGIVSGTAAYELYFGTLIHDAMAAIATQHQSGSVDIDAIASAGRDQLVAALDGPNAGDYPREQGALAEGIIRGFYRYAWPKLLDLYPKIIVIEQEVLTEGGFMVKPDLILQGASGELVYVEYKTTGNKSDKWIDSWKWNPQLHSYMSAIKEALGIDIAAALIVGMYKGYENKWGQRITPFCYAHARAAEPPFFEEELLYTYKAGYKRTPAWELPGGSKQWMEGMPQDVLEDQFLFVPPILLREDLAGNFFRQAEIRENEITQGLKFLKMAETPEDKQGILDAWFPQNAEGCRPSFGGHCPYASICLDGGSPDDEQKWQPREPHHSSEVIQREAKNVV